MAISTIDKVKEVLLNAKSSNRLKKKKREEEEAASRYPVPGQSLGHKGTAGLVKRPPVVDSVGDIFEGLGKYDPVGPDNGHIGGLVDKEEGELVQLVEEEPCTTTAGLDATPARRKRYFSGPDPEDVGVPSQQETDILAPVKALVRAQAERDSAQAARMEEASSSMTGPTRSASMGHHQEEGKVHRDVIGVLEGLDNSRKGEAMGRGSYDVYPESADNEVRRLVTDNAL